MNLSKNLIKEFILIHHFIQISLLFVFLFVGFLISFLELLMLKQSYLKNGEYFLFCGFFLIF